MNSSKGEAAISNFTRSMQSAGDAASARFQSVGRSITGVGDNIKGVGGQLTRGITAPVGIAVGAVGGLTAALGWGRLKSVDTAQAQLKGLGYNTEDVNRITGQLTKALEGGMLTMGEATSAAASGMASGVEEGKELTRYIKVLDGAVAGSNGTFDEMNQIFARVQGSGKLMTGELDMIEQRMPGFSATMAKELGVPQEKLREMVSAGEISSDEFMDIMEGFAGDMATEYAKSWEGMVQNAKAYIGIIGEQLLGGVFEQSKDSIAEFIDWMKSDEVQAWAAETGQALGDAFSKILSGIKTVVTWFANLPGPVQKFALVLGGVAVAAGPVLLVIGTMISTIGTLVTTFGTILGVIAKIPAPLNILGGLFRMISPLLGLLKVGLLAVGGALKALWLTMLANPIVLIIAAVVAIVAARRLVLHQTETGKKMWSAFMDWLGQAWEWIKTTAVTVWTAIVDAIVDRWEWIKTTSANIWNGFIDWIVGLWTSIVTWASTTFNDIVTPSSGPGTGLRRRPLRSGTASSTGSKTTGHSSSASLLARSAWRSPWSLSTGTRSRPSLPKCGTGSQAQGHLDRHHHLHHERREQGEDLDLRWMDLDQVHHRETVERYQARHGTGHHLRSPNRAEQGEPDQELDPQHLEQCQEHDLECVERHQEWCLERH